MDTKKEEVVVQKELLTALIKRDPATVRRLCECQKGEKTVVLATRCNERGDTALHLAASADDNADMVELLLSLGADASSRNKLNETALHHCAQTLFVDGQSSAQNAIRVVHALVQAGADVNAQTRSGLTPLMTACIYGNGNTLAALLNLGGVVNVNFRNEENGYAALHYAAMIHPKSQECILVNDLVELRYADIHVDVQDNKGQTPLHVAVRCGELENAESLILHCGADWNVQDEACARAVDYAPIDAGRDVIYLLSHGRGGSYTLNRAGASLKPVLKGEAYSNKRSKETLFAVTPSPHSESPDL